VVEAANHGQTVIAVDMHLRGDGRLEDGGDVAKAEKVAELSRQIRKLESRINGWEKGGTVDAADLAARKDDLDRLRREKSELEAAAPPPHKGSFFEYRVVEVREGIGTSDAVETTMRAYYQRVNEHNKVAFADRRPPLPAEGEAGYVGVDACNDCHPDARLVWDKTAHARAYATLVKDFKEYNLDCVGCHVTGYGKPGGSTVTHNEQLRGVQCEDCHGPASRHVADPENDAFITLAPNPKLCVDACHHPPHVEDFDAKAKMELVLGPGHGLP
jgi:hypothetical protein